MRQRKRFFLALAGILCFGLAAHFIITDNANAASQVIRLKFANYFPPMSKQSKICEEFISVLEKRTDGQVKTSYFPGGSLLKAPAMLDGVIKGIADIGLAAVVYTPNRLPVTEAVEGPMGYPSGWVACHVVNDFYNEFKPKEWDDVKVLWMHACAPNIIICKKPIRKLEDLKGVTLRAPGRMGDTVRALGGTPRPTPMMETYDGIAKGVIDGVNTPFETLKTFRFAEVVGYTTASWQVGNVQNFYVVMNKKAYEKLPADIKLIFHQVAGEFTEKFALMWNEIEFSGKEFAIEKKVELIYLTPEEEAKFKKAVEPVIGEYIKKMVGDGYPEAEVKKWIAFIRERIDYWTKKQIEYRITSPTGPPGMKQ
ncbi:MAG: TRAP transporter substrate-binding protein [Pseudomonadota bacterium]